MACIDDCQDTACGGCESSQMLHSYAMLVTDDQVQRPLSQSGITRSLNVMRMLVESS